MIEPWTVPEKRAVSARHIAVDCAGFTLDQTGAGNVAFHPPVDVQVGAGLDVALDREIGAKHGKGGTGHVTAGLQARHRCGGLLREHGRLSPGKAAG
jgi:hypothetical protein